MTKEEMIEQARKDYKEKGEFKIFGSIWDVFHPQEVKEHDVVVEPIGSVRRILRKEPDNYRLRDVYRIDNVLYLESDIGNQWSYFFKNDEEFEFHEELEKRCRPVDFFGKWVVMPEGGFPEDME
jgi:hypothetical protein